MKIKFVYKILPAFIFVSENLEPQFGGKTNGPVIRIREKYQNDDGLLHHELTHVKQWYRTLFLHSLLYKFSLLYRLDSEVEAYKEQLKYYKDDRSKIFARFIATEYGLDVSEEEVLDELR